MWLGDKTDKTKLKQAKQKTHTQNNETLPEITYIACVGRKWEWVQLQSDWRVFGAQLLQFLLQKKPLNLQLGFHALRQSNLLPALLHCMFLTELVDSGQSQGGYINFMQGNVSKTEDLTSQYSNASEANRQHQVHKGINKKLSVWIGANE